MIGRRTRISVAFPAVIAVLLAGGVSPAAAASEQAAAAKDIFMCT